MPHAQPVDPQDQLDDAAQAGGGPTAAAPSGIASVDAAPSATGSAGTGAAATGSSGIDASATAELPGSSALSYTVAAVARRLGVAPSTLRTWDRRYRLGPSQHAAGSHRRYTAADLTRLILMRRLVAEGVPAADAAVIARTHLQPADEVSLAMLDASPRPEPADGSTGLLAAAAGPGEPIDLLAGPVHAPWLTAAGALAGRERQGRRPGGGRMIPMPSAGPEARGLARAAMALDIDEVARVLRGTIGGRGVIHAWEELISPVLGGIAERCRTTGEGIEVERAFTEVVGSVLREAVRERLAGPEPIDRPVLLACPADEPHILSLHALAAALAAEGIGCRLLSGLPDAALVAAVRRTGPAVVVLHSSQPVVAAPGLAAIPRQRPAPAVIVGGAGWRTLAPPPPVTVAAGLPDAVRQVRIKLG